MRRWVGILTLLVLVTAPAKALAEALAEEPTVRVPSLGSTLTPPPEPVNLWRRGGMVASYAGLYAGATKVGSRFGLESRFKIVRLESAYAYDLVAHVFNVREIANLMTSVGRLGGVSESRARTLGAWVGGFGSLTYMEVINGFMPGVRFDPLDPFANALGAWLATGGRDLAARHPHLQRFSLQFGFKSWSRAFGPAQSNGFLGNFWHDYPNGRFGVGYRVGSMERPVLDLMATYEITSWDLPELRNRFGFGVELQPVAWVTPWLNLAPGGRHLVALFEWFNDRLLVPGLFIELFSFDVAPFSDRDPFLE